MNDRLADLDRRWEADPSESSRAAILRERVRLGALTEERLALAAWLGCSPARKAAKPEELVALERARTERSQNAVIDDFSRSELHGALLDWALLLPSLEFDVVSRAAVAAARVATQAHLELAEFESNLNAVETFLVGRQRIEEFKKVSEWSLDHDPPYTDSREVQGAFWALRQAHLMTSYDPRDGELPDISSVELIEMRKQYFDHRQELPLTLAAAVTALPSDGHEKVTDAVRSDLVPWLLGLQDPIKQRIVNREERRQRLWTVVDAARADPRPTDSLRRQLVTLSSTERLDLVRAYQCAIRNLDGYVSRFAAALLTGRDSEQDYRSFLATVIGMGREVYEIMDREPDQLPDKIADNWPTESWIEAPMSRAVVDLEAGGFVLGPWERSCLPSLSHDFSRKLNKWDGPHYVPRLYRRLGDKVDWG